MHGTVLSADQHPATTPWGLGGITTSFGTVWHDQQDGGNVAMYTDSSMGTAWALNGSMRNDRVPRVDLYPRADGTAPGVVTTHGDFRAMESRMCWWLATARQSLVGDIDADEACY